MSAPLAKSRISALVYSRAIVACVPSTETRLLTESAQAGLMAGTVPMKGTWKRARNCGSTSVEAVLQAMITRSGRWLAMRSPISSMRRAISARFVAAPVGKKRVVGHIEHARVRAARPRPRGRP